MFFIPTPTLPPQNYAHHIIYEHKYSKSTEDIKRFKAKNKIALRIFFSKDKKPYKPEIKEKNIALISTDYKDSSEIKEKFDRIKNLQKGGDLTLKEFIDDFAVKAILNNLISFPITDTEKIEDPKTKEVPVILIPSFIKKEQAVNDDLAKVEVLPKLQKDKNKIKRITSPVEPNAIIWLPKPYLIAGSFHTETYPHDTTSVLWGLLELLKNKSAEIDFIPIIKDQLENFSFQANTLGFPLNGNRGYFISRSQTNVIPTNVLQFYNLTSDVNWLKDIGLPLSKSIFEYWTNEVASIRTKSGYGYRWIVHGNGPCKEVIDSHEEHNYYYFKVLKTLTEYLLIHDLERPDFAKGFDYKKVINHMPDNTIEKSKLILVEGVPFEDANSKFYYLNGSIPLLKFMDNYYELTPFYYLNDRASRASGYDTNHLYGPFNAFTYDFIPVDHNLILYKSAIDLSKIYQEIDNGSETKKYLRAGEDLKKMILSTLWDEKQGMFFEYDSSLKTLRTKYPFASSGYALWAEIFDISNLKEKNMLLKLVGFMGETLEGKDGFYASSIETGLHWDKPYTWPVQQVYIVGGLRSYANKLKEKGDIKNANYLTNIADRISIKYLLANYIDWLKSSGEEIGEKVISGNENENLLTGYATGSNYTWNLSGVMYLYYSLSPGAKEFLESSI